MLILTLYCHLDKFLFVKGASRLGICLSCLYCIFPLYNICEAPVSAFCLALYQSHWLPVRLTLRFMHLIWKCSKCALHAAILYCRSMCALICISGHLTLFFQPVLMMYKHNGSTHAWTPSVMIALSVVIVYTPDVGNMELRGAFHFKTRLYFDPLDRMVQLL